MNTFQKMITLALFVSSTAFANTGDLELPGAKWQAKFTKYVCQAFSPAVSAPSSHADFQVKFEDIVTDYTLDNGLIKATFVEDGKSCRYSAILFADNAASTIKFVESKAYALEDGSPCLEGQAMLDEHLQFNDYLYYGHPHNLAIMIPATGAAEVCGEGATLIGVNFQVSGRISK